MKLGPRELGAFLSQPGKNTQAVLLYGPDGGLVRERSRNIAATMLGKNPDPLNKIELSGEQIKSDPALLLDELCALSLMGGNRVVILRDPGEKLEPVIRSAFEGTKPSAYLIVEGGELSSTSSLRKLFEKEDYLAAIACYLEDERGLGDLIRNRLEGYGLRVSHDALAYLTANLGNDRMVTTSELDKIALYMGDDKEVSLEIAALLTGNNSSEDIEDLCHSIALGKNASQKLLTRLLNEGVQPVAIVRSLIRYFQRLDLVQGYINSGQSRDQAIKMLRPPVFFKSVPIIERAVSRWSAQKIAYCLNLLLRTEKELKSGILSPALITGHAIQTIQGI